MHSGFTSQGAQVREWAGCLWFRGAVQPSPARSISGLFFADLPSDVSLPAAIRFFSSLVEVTGGFDIAWNAIEMAPGYEGQLQIQNTNGVAVSTIHLGGSVPL